MKRSGMLMVLLRDIISIIKIIIVIIIIIIISFKRGNEWISSGACLFSPL